MSWVDNAFSWHILLHHKARTTQESKVTIITAAEIQKGDLIRVTNTEQQEDRKYSHTYEGVAAVQDADYKGRIVWRTEKSNNLWVHEEDVVIELLDRPKPKIEVPTGRGAVVTYQYGRLAGGDLEKRTVVRDSSAEGGWIAYDDGGVRMNGFSSDEYFSKALTERESMHDLKVIFEGVAK